MGLVELGLMSEDDTNNTFKSFRKVDDVNNIEQLFDTKLQLDFAIFTVNATYSKYISKLLDKSKNDYLHKHVAEDAVHPSIQRGVEIIIVEGMRKPVGVILYML